VNGIAFERCLLKFQWICRHKFEAAKQPITHSVLAGLGELAVHNQMLPRRDPDARRLPDAVDRRVGELETGVVLSEDSRRKDQIAAVDIVDVPE
jgi:hypothetical protein